MLERPARQAHQVSDNRSRTRCAFRYTPDTAIAAKRCCFAGRALTDALLRPYGLGSTQWSVLHRLVTAGLTKQRDFSTALHIEKATLSGVVATLVRKGLTEQVPDELLRLSASGRRLWKKLPDPGTLIQSVAFEGFTDSELEVARRVLQGATERLNQHIAERSKV